MQNLSDNDLDKRFQEAAEKYRPSFEPEAWQAMENRLGNAAQKTDSGPSSLDIKKILPLVLIFLAGSFTGILTWSYLSSDFQESNKAASLSIEPDKAIEDGASALRAETDDGIKGKEAGPEAQAANAQLTETVNEQDFDQSGTKADTRAKPATTESSAGPGNKPGSTTLSARNRVEIQPSGALNRFSRREEPPAQISLKNETPTKIGESVGKTPSIIPGDEETAPDSPAGTIVSDRTRSSNGSNMAVVTDSLETDAPTDSPPGDVLQNETQDETGQKEKLNASDRLSVIAAISPDFSSVNFGEQTKPGSNFGLLVEYHFSRRFSIQTGAILSKKLYTASNLEYGGHYVSEAEGDCRIIDIPVNVYVRFGSGKRFSFFTSAGLSSYIMKNEDYTFYVDGYNGPYEYAKEVRNENNEWLKVLNFSGGITRQLTPRVSLEAEPFVKMPLSGIGDGKLNVNTVGMFLRLRYAIIQTH